MSQPQRPPGGVPEGLVHGAEKMQAGPPPDRTAPQPVISPSPPRQRPAEDGQPFQQSPPRIRPFNETPLSTQQPSRSRQQLPAALSISKAGPGIGVAISRPTPAPQWPLPGTFENGQGQLRANGQYQPPPGRDQAPQRPPRPRNVPSMLDASRIQEHTPAFQYKPKPVDDVEQEAKAREQSWVTDDGLNSPDDESPMSGKSRPSTLSSVGSIPDFPVPIPPPPPPPVRRTANLGPPPTSRRGGSSYYSGISYVSPIPEESSRPQSSHQSYASSTAIPTSWGTNFPPQDPYVRDKNMSPDNSTIEEGRESRESNVDDNEERGLVRSASIGRKGKPTMVMNKAAEKTDTNQKPLPRPTDKLAKMGVFGPAEMKAATERAGGGPATGSTVRPSAKVLQLPERTSIWPNFGPDSPVASGTGFIDESSSSESIPKLAKSISTGDNSTSSTDSQGKATTKGLPQVEGGKNISRLSAMRRPPRLDLDSAKTAETRNSSTSLPELIRRATRLAAMMDRGGRPGSRLNDLNDFSTDSDLSREKSSGASEGKHQSGLSGMLAAFPPPGLATPTLPPTRDPSPLPPSAWQGHSPNGAPRGTAHEEGSGQSPKRRTKCCGLPVPVFLLIVGCLLLIIVAAIIVPIELIVVHKPTSSATTSQTPVSACQQNIICENGGTVIASGNGCSCICANGYTGKTCSTASNRGCTTINIAGGSTSYTNVTLGFAIPRLIQQAEKNFSIPLIAEVIFSRFNAAGFSCDAENALVTFDGLSIRIGSAASIVTKSVSAIPASTPVVKPRQYTATGVGTILHDTSSFVKPTATSSLASPSSTSSSFVVTQEILDFARVSVLFVLQQRELNSAITAQTNIQNFLTFGDNNNYSAAGNLTLGNGNSIDFLDLNVNVGAGSVGGRVNQTSEV